MRLGLIQLHTCERKDRKTLLLHSWGEHPILYKKLLRFASKIHLAQPRVSYMKLQYLAYCDICNCFIGNGIDYDGFNELITIFPTSDTFEFNVTIKADNFVESVPEVFEAVLSLDQPGPILIADGGGVAMITIEDAVG